MSKVLVDRELLEQLLDEGPRSVTWAAQEQARAILAKPEEVDGASIPLTGEYHIDCSYLMNLVDGQRAALSAVTAERDRLREEMAELWKRIDKFQSQSHGITALAEIERLRAEVEALRVALLGIASANPAERGIEWAKAYASDGLSGTGSELYIRWLEAFKEAEALRELLNKALPVVEAHAGASHMLEGFRPARNKWDELVDGIRAAMAAKEA